MGYANFLTKLNVAIENEEQICISVSSKPIGKCRGVGLHMAMDLDSALCDIEENGNESRVYLTDGYTDFNLLVMDGSVTPSGDGYRIDVNNMEIYIDFLNAN